MRLTVYPFLEDVEEVLIELEVADYATAKSATVVMTLYNQVVTESEETTETDSTDDTTDQTETDTTDEEEEN